jgi:hypothetical protein
VQWLEQLIEREEAIGALAGSSLGANGSD